MSSIFKTKTKAKQTGPLSPLLFAIYVDELIELLKELKIGEDVLNVLRNCILFADDILILANSEDELNKLLKIVKSFLLKACNVYSVKISVRIFRNELTEKLKKNFYESDFNTRTHSRSIIGNLIEFTVFRDETLVELVQEALESVDEENWLD
ncbi:unnamed protein product [Brachionus calyciflorus]|uniref:Reverse transcriptase domain-containing protein n=1 Tax=Brachionus calyciflorus TaxID=104777 RepID=A0A813MNT4_9BILA|nr:unnamed protein product [Brachionus calyciflorus]